jgi:formimidoylglutamate deiminase
MVNAHSHSFQRAIRGRTEHRTHAARDTFWTWREAMYHAATRLSPEDIYHVARMAFLEMLLAGITTVGEFHYLHHEANGAPYAEPNLLAEQVIRAARELGMRINLQRTAYVRAGWQKPPDPLQARFITPHAERFISDTESLRGFVTARYAPDEVWVSVAPHSVRAVPEAYLLETVRYARARGMKVHMHAAEQPAEIEACQAEYGAPPLAFLQGIGVLDNDFTAVHAIHISTDEIRFFRETGARICACPTTERNLGDGIGPAEKVAAHRIGVCYGSDSNIQIDLLEDARALEYHSRLKLLERAVLSPGCEPEALAAHLFHNATREGAASVGVPAGALEPGLAADFFTVDLNEPSVAGAGEEALLSNIVFSAGRSAIREVFVGGNQVIRDGRHALQEEIIQRFEQVQSDLWSNRA